MLIDPRILFESLDETRNVLTKDMADRQKMLQALSKHLPMRIKEGNMEESLFAKQPELEKQLSEILKEFTG